MFPQTPTESRSPLSHSTPVHQPKGPLGLEADGVEVAAREMSGCCKQAPRHGLSDPWLLRLQGSSGVHGHLRGASHAGHFPGGKGLSRGRWHSRPCLQAAP